ncbi:MAG TPA: hypothetical protein P5565_12365 [Bacteroidia bacterium]|jgi:hypothetical protein|nr:hypothetical protein [Bacteroidia bacterium]
MTSHSELFGPRSFPFMDELVRARNTNNYFRLMEVFRDRPITLSDLQGFYDEREQLYKLTHELIQEVTRFYEAARKFAADNAELQKELDGLKKSIQWETSQPTATTSTGG